ncbi:hypothetical protein P5673_024458 [Acropora cervicornis]|uniref:Uncharacterized protein n=1 Tax=Acropora cervicornis TaxID=6130 RepID=A0AAD9Q3L1_ACRCE|nr:hypothetical protein P5673_024458 [Acropora cervicornis]
MLEENEAQAAKVPSESDIQAQMFISDMLSQAPLLICNANADPLDYVIFQVNEQHKFHKEVERNRARGCNLCHRSPRANTLSIHTLMSLIMSE